MANNSNSDQKEIWPWTRFLARLVDAGIFLPIYLTIEFFILYVINSNWIKNFNFEIIILSNETLKASLSTYGLMIPIIIIALIFYSLTDSVISKKFGRNIGHKIFGLEIVNFTNHALHYSDYLKRSFLVSGTLFLLALPAGIIALPFSLGIIIAIPIYINYRKTGSTFWDRRSCMAVMSRNASTMRTALCISVGLNLFFILLVNLCIFLGYLSYHLKATTLNPQQKAFIETQNRALPHRFSNILIAEKINIEDGNVVFHYAFQKEGNAPFTNRDSIRMGIIRLTSPRTALNYLCSLKGRNVFMFGKEVVYIYTYQGTILFQYRINPKMCPHS